MKKIKNVIENILKSNLYAYKLYTSLFSMLIRFYGIFIPIDSKLIIFNSFGGKKYDDSPKVIYEQLKKDPRFSNYKLVWAFHNPEEYLNTELITIKVDGFKYFHYLMKAKVWITNSSMERGLNIKKSDTICLNSWHGTPIKLMGKDKVDEIMSSRMDVDMFTVQSQYDIDIFSNAYNIPEENFFLCGLPRNDELLKGNSQNNKLREIYNIDKDKKIILYAPTFRNYNRTLNGVELNSPININKWKKVLGNEYVIFIRAHYEVIDIMNINFDNKFIFNMSNYPNLSELMLVSDMLITDYSSIMFDYSILEKPIYLFTYDYKKYKEERGMYFSIKNNLPIPSIDNEDKLLKKIIDSNDQIISHVVEVKKKFVQHYGNATTKIVDALYQKIDE